MSARALKCTHKQTHIVWPIEEAFSGWNQNNLPVFSHSPLWRRSVSLQYVLLSFLVSIVWSIFPPSESYAAVWADYMISGIIFFFHMQREWVEKASRKMKIGQTQCPSSSYGINEFLIRLWQLWVRGREGELMEAEICCCRSFLNSWLRQQMWSRYLIALLCRAKTA